MGSNENNVESQLVEPKKTSKAKKDKKRRYGDGSVRTLPNGKKRLHKRINAPLGQTLYKDFYGDTVEECEAKWREYQLTHPDGEPFKLPETLTIGRIVRLYLDEVIDTPRKADSTKYQNDRAWRVVIQPKLEHFLAHQYTVSVGNRLVRESEQSGVAPSLIRTAVKLIGSAINYANQNNAGINNPTRDVKLPKLPGRKARAYTKVEVQNILEAAAGRLDRRTPVHLKSGEIRSPPPIETTLYLLYVIAFTVGCRIGELLGFQRGDLVGKKLYVRRQVLTTGKVKHELKSQTSRHHDVSARFVELWNEHLDWMDRNGWTADTEYLFACTDGQPYSQAMIRTHYKNVCAAAGVEMQWLHALRHTAGSHMLHHGATIVDAARRLGHKNIQTTLNTYLHELGDDAQEQLDCRMMDAFVPASTANSTVTRVQLRCPYCNCELPLDE